MFLSFARIAVLFASLVFLSLSVFWKSEPSVELLHPTPVGSSLDRQHIRLGSKVEKIDFGPILVDCTILHDKLDLEIALENDLDSSAVVKLTDRSCSCIGLDVNELTLEPGATESLHLGLEFKNDIHDFRHLLKFEINTGRGTSELVIFVSAECFQSCTGVIR